MQWRNTAWVLLLATMVALAGCGGTTDDGADDSDPTPGDDGDGTASPSVPENVPNVEFTVDESLDQLRVKSSSDDDGDWDRLGVQVKGMSFGATIYMGQTADGGYQNEKALASGKVVSTDAPTEITDESDPIDPDATEYVEFCADGTATDVVIGVHDTTADQPLGDYTFETISSC